MNIRFVLRCLPLLATVSCGGAGSAGPSDPMTLTFAPESSSGTGARVANGALRCDMDMTIVAHGGGDHLVTLQTISATFYDSTGAKLNTVAASPSDWFGIVQLRTDQSASAHRQPTGSGPFRVTTELAYVDQFTAPKVATFTFVCSG